MWPIKRRGFSLMSRRPPIRAGVWGSVGRRGGGGWIMSSRTGEGGIICMRTPSFEDFSALSLHLAIDAPYTFSPEKHRRRSTKNSLVPPARTMMMMTMMNSPSPGHARPRNVPETGRIPRANHSPAHPSLTASTRSLPHPLALSPITAKVRPRSS